MVVVACVLLVGVGIVYPDRAYAPGDATVLTYPRLAHLCCGGSGGGGGGGNAGRRASARMSMHGGRGGAVPEIVIVGRRLVPPFARAGTGAGTGAGEAQPSIPPSLTPSEISSLWCARRGASG